MLGMAACKGGVCKPSPAHQAQALYPLREAPPCARMPSGLHVHAIAGPPGCLPATKRGLGLPFCWVCCYSLCQASAAVENPEYARMAPLAVGVGGQCPPDSSPSTHSSMER